MNMIRCAMLWTAVGAVALAGLLLGGCDGGKSTRADEGYQVSSGPADKENLPLLLVQPFFAAHLPEHAREGLVSKFTTELFQACGAYRVLNHGDVSNFMKTAEDQTLLGSCLEGECLRHLSEKLDAKIIVQVNISLVGERTLIQASLVDGPAASILKRLSRELDTDQVEKVLDEMGPLARKVAAEL
jgi:hypothetical protein